jgi:hypothetical protein
MLCVECTEYHEERSKNVTLQLQNGFGLTQLGGLTVRLGQESVNKIIKLNYEVENQNQVGLFLPYNLVIAPSSFFKKVYLNNFDFEVHQHLDEIIVANESHKKKSNIYINFLYPFTNPNYWENDVIKNLSLNNMEHILSSKKYFYTKRIYLVC